MSEISKTRLATIEAPYRREVKLDEVTFDSGMKLLRVVIREGHRITQLDIDRATAETWGSTLLAWAQGKLAADESTP